MASRLPHCFARAKAQAGWIVKSAVGSKRPGFPLGAKIPRFENGGYPFAAIMASRTNFNAPTTRPGSHDLRRIPKTTVAVGGERSGGMEGSASMARGRRAEEAGVAGHVVGGGSGRGDAGKGGHGIEGLGIKDRFKLIVKEYGKVALLSHSTIWAGSLAATYAVLQGMDMDVFLSMLPHSMSSHIDPKAGAFAVAFVLTKLTGPGRLMIDIAITPTLAGYLRRTWLAGPLGLRPSSEMVRAHPMTPWTSRAKADSYRVMGALGRQQAMVAGGRYRVRAQQGRERVKTAAGAVLVRVGGWGKRVRGGETRKPTHSVF